MVVGTFVTIAISIPCVGLHDITTRQPRTWDLGRGDATSLCRFRVSILLATLVSDDS